jgi:hypothetical protein
MAYPDYPVLPQYLYGDWKMYVNNGLQDNSAPFGQRESIECSDNAYVSLTLNPDKTYRVVLFDGHNRKHYIHPENHWEIEQIKDEKPNLILYHPPNYMPRTSLKKLGWKSLHRMEEKAVSLSGMPIWMLPTSSTG